MDDLYSASQFVFTLPVWTIAFANRIADRGVAGSIPRLNADGLPEFMGIFTDEDLANRYIAAAAPDAGLRAVAIESNESFASILEGMLTRGTQYVSTDPDARGANQFRLNPIVEFLAAIRGQGDT